MYHFRFRFYPFHTFSHLGDCLTDRSAEFFIDETDYLVVGLIELRTDEIDVSIQTGRKGFYFLQCTEYVSCVQRYIFLQFADHSVDLGHSLI